MTDYRYFFIVGAQRCGTTFLYHALDAHPEIEMAAPLRPEPKVFLSENPPDAAGYARAHFSGGARIRGEKSTSYIESETAARHIAATFPEARIVFALRNPVERAISNYWFSVNHGVETAPIETALLREDERRDVYDRCRFSTSPFAYLQRGQYIDYIRLYERFFAPEHITVLIFEQFTTVPAEILSRLYAALGADPDFVPPNMDQAVNPSQHPDGAEVSVELRGYLRAHFAGYNARLADYLNLDLTSYGW